MVSKLAGIELNRKMLSEIAIADKAAYRYLRKGEGCPLIYFCAGDSPAL